MTILENTRDFLKDNQLDYLLVNSTNEFLVEYNELERNSRYKLTGFSGSTGEALLSLKNLYLFVDGRYHIQADLEVKKDITSVVKLQTGDKFIDKFVDLLTPNSTLALVATKISQFKLEAIEKAVKLKNIKIKLLDFDPILETKIFELSHISELPIELTGKTKDEKIKELTAALHQGEALFITNLEDVSYIFNCRDFSKSNSCSINAKALISKSETKLITGDISDFIEPFTKIFIDKKSITAFDFKTLGKKAVVFPKNPVMILKSIKNDTEIEHYKKAFEQTDKALLAVRNYIYETENISEFDISQKLEEEFYKNGAKSLSFTSIVAKDSNSALAHYSKSSKNEIVKDGSLVLIDCGAYFEGGLATDITRVFVKGTPSTLQKTVYTSVLKAFLNAYNYKPNKNTSGFDIDNFARVLLNKIAPAGFEFNHGLGHGIGISVHEFPPRLGVSDESKFKLADNMCFTIEPGLYCQNYFGVRLENSCFLKNGKINSFTNMCYEKKLIDYELLSEQEKLWLKSFEVL